MEYVKNQGYLASYESGSIPEAYCGYIENISISAINIRDGNIQKITLAMKQHEVNVTSLEGYKLN